jgi:catechol 2,3-dioxygenase-like lactoylglutathione lyase family enzyme
VPIVSIDHAAIPIARVDEMLALYRALGFVVDESRAPVFYSVHLADQKINFHGPSLWQSGKFSLRGPTAEPGCGDFCFVWEGSVEQVLALLEDAGATVIEGPVDRDGGREEGRCVGSSVYIRDPDENLLEFICYS